MRILVLGGVLVVGVLALGGRDRATEPERWFMPGPLGREGAGWVTALWFWLAGNGDPASQRKQQAVLDGVAGPGFLTRGMSGVDANWARRNALTPWLPAAHTLTEIFPPSLFRDHPEFFPWEAGRRVEPPPGSAFWNPDIAREDVARYAAGAARRHFEANPAALAFSLGTNDALVWGESPELRALVRPGAWFRERPDYANLVFTFMNRAAGELEKTHPDKYLLALAYYWAENAPDFALHPQVLPFLTADRAQGYDADFRREELELQAEWGRLAGRRDAGQRDRTAKSAFGPPRRLGIYDYLYGGGYLIPRIHTRLLAENLRHARGEGFTDYYAEANPNWGLDGPMPWLTAQLLQDPEQPAPALLLEYYRRYFREAAGPMRRFFERCEELWMTQPGPPYWLKHFRNQSQAVVFPPEACRELRALLTEAEKAARSSRVRQRVAWVSRSFGVTERFVHFEEARGMLTRAALAADAGATDSPATAGGALAGLAPASSAEDFAGRGGEENAVAAAPAIRATAAPHPVVAALTHYLETRRDFIRHTVGLRHAEPLALHRIGWDDYLKDDPVPLALHALERTGALLGVVPDLLIDARWSELRRAMDFAGGASGRPADGASSPPAPREMLRNAGMVGPLAPARTIAGLSYGVALPAEWQSRVEPAQYHRAELSGTEKERILRIVGTKDTTVQQWVSLDSLEAGGGRLHRAAVTVRGNLSPGTAVSLVLSWLDAGHRHVGFRMVRLPDGEWPDWVILRQAGVVPENAAWAGLGLRVQNQVAGDWVEAKAFGLTK